MKSAQFSEQQLKTATAEIENQTNDKLELLGKTLANLQDDKIAETNRRLNKVIEIQTMIRSDQEETLKQV